MAQNVSIATRYLNKKTHRIEFDEGWLLDDDWNLPIYEVDDLHEGETFIELTKLRIKITEDSITRLRNHLSATYAKFINKNVEIEVNSIKITPLFFENWSYPPDYGPKKYYGELKVNKENVINVDIIAGLSTESSPAAGEYGVYIYCNDRLIARGLKNFEVGFSKGFAGLPHPKISLVKVLIFLKGNAVLMPWNSSKSDIYFSHPIFLQMRSKIIDIVTHYASLSRRWMGNWPEKVFKYKSGVIEEIELDDIGSVEKLYLPALPKTRPRYIDIVKNDNKGIGKKKPWTRGLYESIIAFDMIFKQNLEQKNRICLIILDSTIEIAFKEYLANETGVHYSDSQLLNIFKTRHSAETEVEKYKKIGKTLKSQIKYFYSIRCNLIHQRASVTISDDMIMDHLKVVKSLLKKLFKIKFD